MELPTFRTMRLQPFTALAGIVFACAIPKRDLGASTSAEMAGADPTRTSFARR